MKELKGIPDINKYQQFEAAIKKIKNDGGACFTNAHQTMGFHRYFSLMHDLRRNKYKLLKSLSADIYVLSNDDEENNLEEIFYTIKTLPNVGDFLAWQGKTTLRYHWEKKYVSSYSYLIMLVFCCKVTCDLLESDVLPKCHENQFVQLGPGARSKFFFPIKLTILLTSQAIHHLKTDYQFEMNHTYSRIKFDLWSKS